MPKKLVQRSLVAISLFLFSATAVAQQEPTVASGNHMDISGGRQYMPLERPSVNIPEQEGILGRFFPNAHGGEAIHLDYVYSGGVFNNSRGGLQTRDATSYVGIATISIVGDTEKLGLWKNGTFFVNSLFSHGPSPSRFIGDVQGAAVFAYETPAQVSEYWYEHRFFRDKLSIKGGKVDAGTDFFYLDATADFINSSYTCVPTTRIPTAPNNAWGVAGTWWLTKNFHVKAGIFDGEGDANKFWMSETGKVYGAYQLEYHYSLCCGLPGFVYLGGWNDDCSYEMLDDDSVTKRGNGGISFGFEQALYRKNVRDAEDRQGAYVFAQYGNAKSDRSEISDYWGLGFLWRGIGERTDDSLGLAVNYAYLSKRLDLPYAYESALELYYKLQLTKNWSLQPDIQYIAHPGGEHRDALVTGLVFQLIF